MKPLIPDVVYVKTPDGVIVRFAERAALEKWLVAGRIPVDSDRGPDEGPNALWLDTDNSWKPLPELLQKLGISIQGTREPSGPEPFPGATDEFFKNSFGPEAARRPITGQFGAVAEPVQETPRRTGTTAPMAAFNVTPEPAAADESTDEPQVTERLRQDDIVDSGVVAESPDEADEVEAVPEGLMFETTPASVSPVLSVRRKKSAPSRREEPAQTEEVEPARAHGGPWKVLVVVGVLTLVGVAAFLTQPYWYREQARPVAETEPVPTTPAAPPEKAPMPAPAPAPVPAPVPVMVPEPAPSPIPSPEPLVKSPSVAAVTVEAVPAPEPKPVSKPVPAPAPEPKPVAKPVPAPAPEPKTAAKPVSVTAPEPKAAAKPAPAPEPDDEPYIDEPVAANNYDGHMKAGDKALSRDPQVALAHYEMAHQLKPGSTVPLQKMGEASFRLKRYEAAQEYFESATAINPNYGPALIGQARVAKARGRIDDARRLYQSYLEVNPNGTQAAEARQYLENQ